MILPTKKGNIAQVLHCPYEAEKAKLVLREMADLLVLNLVDKGLVEHLDDEPEVKVTYFKADERKAGGAYIEAIGIVKKLDDFERLITMKDGRKIPTWRADLRT